MHEPVRVPTQVEGDLHEYTNHRGEPCIYGEIAGARVTAWRYRTERDEQTGRTRRVWRFLAEKRR